MIIIKIMGGLGNQMFQYALYRKFASLNRSASLDIRLFNEYSMHNGFELDKVFGIDPIYARSNDIKNLGDTNNGIIDKIRRKIGLIKKTHIKQMHQDIGIYDSKIFNLNDAYLDGYWQSEKYFKDIEHIIRSDFTFKGTLDYKNEEILKTIENANSISIHIRRGDYLNIRLHQEICTQEYYNNAINYINSIVNNPKFFIFSDDIIWCKNNIKIKDTTFIDWNHNFNNYIDMRLMSKCKHNIIANSSFSWWAAWLNNNINKKVIAPRIWFNDKKLNQQDIIPLEWIRL